MFDLEIENLKSVGLHHAKVDIGLPSPHILYTDINQQDTVGYINDGMTRPTLELKVNVVYDDFYQSDEVTCDYVDLTFLAYVDVDVDLINQKVVGLECVEMALDDDDSNCFYTDYDNTRADFPVHFTDEYNKIQDLVASQIEEKAVISWDIR